MDTTVNTNLIAEAVAHLKTETVDRVRAITLGRLTEMAEGLVGRNLRTEAPLPRSTMSRAEYISAKDRYALARRITHYSRSGAHVGADEIVTGVDKAAIEALAQEAADDAALSFDAYVAKLTSKVGDVDSARVCGARLWQGSTLTVTKGDTVERWHTQQIINFSALGRAFNQWPTRKLK